MFDHATTCTLTRDDDDIDVDVEYSVSRLYPARGPSWSSPGEPAEGGEIEALEATINGNPLTLTASEIEQIEHQIYDTHQY